ncbi:MAG: alpha/beta hydrolase [Pseudomonadota bacterium]
MSVKLLLLVSFTLVLGTILFSFIQDRAITRRKQPAGDLITTDEGLVHVIKRGRPGEKLPVVMVHGTFTNGLDMDIDLARELATERLVLSPDRPGHGFSDRPRDGFRMDVQVAAMREAVRAKGAERYVVVGQSYGAATALVWALAYPEDVAGIVLVAPVSHPWPGGLRWYAEAGNHPYYGWFFRRSFIALFCRYGLRRAVERSLAGAKAVSYYFDRVQSQLAFRAQEFKWNAEDLCRLYEQLVPLSKRYHEIDVPAEVVAGTHDLTVLLPVHGRKLQAEIPDCGLDIIDGGGHALHHTHPDRVLAAIDRLDRRLEIAGRSPLESALRAITAVFPQRIATKQEAS